jgi:NAD(P)-dependent dehydrogenase (short-subunit alcohol dehydrogenase family)
MDCTTLITGGSSGIGRAAALALASPGRRVVVAARGRAARERTVEELRARGGRAEALELVHSAGIVAVHDVLEASVEGIDVYRRMLAEHLDGPRRLDAALLPALRERGGAIVHVASAAGLCAFPRTAAYVAAKHAMLGYVRAAAAELAGSRVQVAALCPYYVDSPMMDRGVAGLAAERGVSEAAARAEFGARNPGGRWVTLDETTAAIADLLVPGRHGRILVLDGGPPRAPDPRLGE